MIKSFDATFEVIAETPTAALAKAKEETWYDLISYEEFGDGTPELYELIEHNIRLLGDDRYEVYLSYKAVEK